MVWMSVNLHAEFILGSWKKNVFQATFIFHLQNQWPIYLQNQFGLSVNLQVCLHWLIKSFFFQDPIFFMFHNNVDRLFEVNKQYEKNKHRDDAELDTKAKEEHHDEKHDLVLISRAEKNASNAGKRRMMQRHCMRPCIVASNSVSCTGLLRRNNHEAAKHASGFAFIQRGFGIAYLCAKRRSSRSSCNVS